MAALTLGLLPTSSRHATAAAEFLAELFGPGTVAVIHYGSHVQGGAGADSAHDFFIIVDRYLDAYRCLCARLKTRYSARIASALNHLLPPNVLAIPAPAGGLTLATKCAVLSLTDLQDACSSRARDHFVQGRLFQHVQLEWSRDTASRSAVITAIREARARTLTWVWVDLPSCFDVETFCRTLLATSYAAEIRPETDDRVPALLEAQRSTLLPMYGALLEHWVMTNVLSRRDHVYCDPRRPGPLDRLATRAYFAVSKLRATLRWIKYVALYDNWLDYVVLKLERRSGVSIRLTPLERRWPLIFVWPRAFRFLLTRHERRR